MSVFSRCGCGNLPRMDSTENVVFLQGREHDSPVLTMRPEVVCHKYPKFINDSRKSCSKAPVKFEDISGHGLRIVVSYLSDGILPYSYLAQNPSLLCEIWIFATCHNLSDVSMQMVSTAISNLSESSFLPVLRTAYILNDFQTIAAIAPAVERLQPKSFVFEELDLIDVEIFEVILMNCGSPYTQFDLARRWLSHGEDRLQYGPRLLYHIDFENVSVEELTDSDRYNFLVRIPSCAEVHKLANEKFVNHLIDCTRERDFLAERENFETGEFKRLNNNVKSAFIAKLAFFKTIFQSMINRGYIFWLFYTAMLSTWPRSTILSMIATEIFYQAYYDWMKLRVGKAYIALAPAVLQLLGASDAATAQDTHSIESDQHPLNS